MHNVKPIVAAVMAASLMLFATGAPAHGDNGRGTAKAFDASRVEERPFGRAGDPSRVDRTIRVGMADTMHFAAGPAQRATDVRAASAPHAMSGDITVKRGETVRFVVRNDGKLVHEMVIGRMKDLKEHAEMMRKFPEMEHDEPYMAHVPPGKEGEIVWQFTRAGEFHYACLVPGHMEAGMISKITVK